MKILILLGLLLATTYSQQLSQCGTSAQTPAKAPVTEQDCNSSNTELSKCCYVESRINSLTPKTCFTLSFDTPWESFQGSVKNLNVNAEVDIKCSATSISVGMILISLLALLLF